MLSRFKQHEFATILGRELSASRPITDPQHLLGRHKKLREVDRAFSAAGRHVFIFGDRGVGKTSLALSAAVLHHPSSSEPISVSCDSRSTFRSLIGDVVEEYLSQGSNDALIDYIKIKLSILEVGKKFQPPPLDEVPIESVNDAARLLSLIAEKSGGNFVVIFDEFEHLADEQSKAMFAGLTKKLSDSDSKIKIIFSGIGSSVEDLLGKHLSIGRCIAPIELDPLTPDALWEIVNNACKSVSISIDNETTTRIALLSDGFPYFVHLVCEYMLWAAFDSDDEEHQIKLPHFEIGISSAIEHSFVFLKNAYDRAVKKYRDDYEEVLWALADRATLSRQTKDIYEKSYIPIMSIRNNLLSDGDTRPTLTIAQFRARLNNLKTERHGEIIRGTGAGWYEFNEKMIRGYVRLRAREKGVELGSDHHYERLGPRPTITHPSSAR